VAEGELERISIVADLVDQVSKPLAELQAKVGLFVADLERRMAGVSASAATAGASLTKVGVDAAPAFRQAELAIAGLDAKLDLVAADAKSAASGVALLTNEVRELSASIRAVPALPQVVPPIPGGGGPALPGGGGGGVPGVPGRGGFGGTLAVGAGIGLGALGATAAIGALFAAYQKLSTGIADATARAAQFELDVAKIATIAGESTFPIQELAQGIRDVAAAQGVAEDVVARGLYEAISSGIEADARAIVFLSEANELAVATLSDTNVAVDVLTSAINAYGLEASDAGRLSDVLFKTVEKGKVLLPELARSLGQVFPLANQLGISFEEVNAGVATLTQAGVPAALAVTQIRSALTSLLRDQEKVQDAFRSIGEDFDANTIRTLGLAGTFEKLREATAGNEDVLVQILGRIEAVNAVLGLTGENADRFSSTMRDVGDAAGSAEAAFRKIQDTSKRTVETLDNELRIAFEQVIGEPALEAQAEFARGLRKVIEESGISREDLRQLAEIVTGAFKGIGQAGVEAFRAVSGFMSEVRDLLASLGISFEDVAEIARVFFKSLASVVLFVPQFRALAFAVEQANAAIEKFRKLLVSVGLLEEQVDYSRFIERQQEQVRRVLAQSEAKLAVAAREAIRNALASGDVQSAISKAAEVDGTDFLQDGGALDGLVLLREEAAAVGQVLVEASEGVRKLAGFTRSSSGEIRANFSALRPAIAEIDDLSDAQFRVVESIRAIGVAVDEAGLSGDRLPRGLRDALAELTRFRESLGFAFADEALPEDVEAAAKRVEKFTDAIRDATQRTSELFAETGDSAGKLAVDLARLQGEQDRLLERLSRENAPEEVIAQASLAFESAARARLDRHAEEQRRAAQDTLNRFEAIVRAAQQAADKFSKSIRDVDQAIDQLGAKALTRTEQQVSALLNRAEDVRQTLQRLQDEAFLRGDVEGFARVQQQFLDLKAAADAARQAIEFRSDVDQVLALGRAVQESADLSSQGFGEIVRGISSVSSALAESQQRAREAGVSFRQTFGTDDPNLDRRLEQLRSVAARDAAGLVVEFSLRPRVDLEREQIEEEVRRAVEPMARELLELTTQFQADGVLSDEEAADLEFRFDRIVLAARRLREQLLGKKETETSGFLAGFQDKLDEFRDSLKQFSDLGQKVAQDLADGLGDALFDIASGVKSIGDAFRDFFRSILADIGREISRIFARQALAGLFPLADGGVISGQMVGSLPVKAYASGGIANSPQVAVFGEAGAEAFVPLPGPNRGIPVEFRGGHSAGISVVIHSSPTIHALDARGVEEILDRHRTTIAELVAAELSGGNSRVLVQSVREAAGSGA
jgi:TP901 family phage tail tape measure protein